MTLTQQRPNCPQGPFCGQRRPLPYLLFRFLRKRSWQQDLGSSDSFWGWSQNSGSKMGWEVADKEHKSSKWLLWATRAHCLWAFRDLWVHTPKMSYLWGEEVGYLFTYPFLSIHWLKAWTGSRLLELVPMPCQPEQSSKNPLMEGECLEDLKGGREVGEEWSQKWLLWPSTAQSQGSVKICSINIVKSITGLH